MTTVVTKYDRNSINDDKLSVTEKQHSSLPEIFIRFLSYAGCQNEQPRFSSQNLMNDLTEAN